MRYLIIGVAAASLLMAGCSKKDDADGASGGTAASATNAAAASSPPVKRDPGKWKVDMKLVKLDVPGAPPQMKEGMENLIPTSMS